MTHKKYVYDSTFSLINRPELHDTQVLRKFDTSAETVCHNNHFMNGLNINLSKRLLQWASLKRRAYFFFHKSLIWQKGAKIVKFSVQGYHLLLKELAIGLSL